MVSFEFLEKSQFDGLSKDIFSILATNMIEITPTGNSYEDDYDSWFSAVKAGIVMERRKIILIRSEDELIGFFQYYTNNTELVMEEIQIRPAWRGKEVFRNLYGFLLPNLHSGIQNVAAYAHKENIRSQEILRHLGLNIDGENKDGTCFHFGGKYDELLRWYCRKI